MKAYFKNSKEEEKIIFDVIAEDKYNQVVVKHPITERLYIVQKNQIVIEEN